MTTVPSQHRTSLYLPTPGPEVKVVLVAGGLLVVSKVSLNVFNFNAGSSLCSITSLTSLSYCYAYALLSSLSVSLGARQYTLSAWSY